MSIPEVRNNQVGSFETLQKAMQVGTSYALTRNHWRTLRTEYHQPLPVGSSLKSQQLIKKEVIQYLQKANQIENGAPAAAGPLFSDELAAFQAIITAKFPDVASKEQVALLKFCNDVVAKSQPTQGSQAAPLVGLSPAQIAARELLGQLLFMADKDAVKTAALIKGKDYEADKKSIQSAFGVEMASIKKDLDAMATNEANLGVCDSILVRSGQIPKIMAKAMVTSTGLINLGIAEPLKKTLFLPSSQPYQKEINDVLVNLEKKQGRFQLISEAKAPASKESPAWALIVATLDLPVDQVVTDVDAKRAALSAHLTLLEQANVGNCFADSVGKLIKKLRPDRFGQDVNVLLTESKLQRKVDGHEQPVDFVLNSNNSDLQKEIKIGKNGSFLQFWGTYYVWQSRGFVMAAKAMGIGQDQYEAAMKGAITSLASKKGTDKFATNAQEIILELALGNAAKAQLGNFGFTSLRENPVLRAWENCLAEMAELRPRSLVRGQILRCVKETLMPQFKPSNLTEDALLSSVFNDFLARFNNSVAIEYTPNAKVQGANQVTKDGVSTSDGAFIIKGVTSGEEFQKLVVTNLNGAIDALAAAANDDTKATLAARADKLNTFVMDKTFLSIAVRNFDPQNVAGKDPVSLPWVAPYGDDPFQVMRTYFEDKQKVTSFKPLDAEDLFVKLIDFARTEKARDDRQKPSRLILCSPQHAFEFTPNLPAFAKGVESSASAKDFVASYVAEAQKVWNSAPIHADGKAKIIQWALENMIPQEIAVAFMEDVKTIDAKAKLGKFHSELVVRIKPYLASLDEATQAKGLRQFNRYLLAEALPENLTESLQGLVVPFADTNWDLENNTLRFCFYPDPIAKKICFGVVANNGTHLLAMNQDEWVNNQDWEIAKTAINVTV